MNYRHAFHAGNFADVMKHAVLALVLTYLNRKDQAYRVIDTHAGLGLYDLAGDAAGRTGEWRDGIGALRKARLEPELAALLKPYLDVVEEVRSDLGDTIYPGSPEIARRLTRSQDRLVAVEKHPVDSERLAQALARDRRAKAITLDGWTALRAYVPPKEKRGLVLIDPPFEEPDEFRRLGEAAVAAWQKWRTGVYMLWYPIKGDRDGDTLDQTLAASGVVKRLRLELTLRPDDGDGRLRGSGLLLVNPPWTLQKDAATLLPGLLSILAKPGRGAAWRCIADQNA
jgi:23S rRNA (adenine2030-N6)-methyltransferase